MKDRIDPLIAERAPWLFRPTPMARAARPLLDRVLHYDRTVALAARVADLPAPGIMAEVHRLIARRVTVSGLHHLPGDGPALVVANHPTGIADGVILHGALAERRPDLYFLANRDILRVLPQMAEMIAPVEWRPALRSPAKTRQTLHFVQGAVAQGRLGVIFPSGRLAQRRGLRLYERPWMASAATLARRFDLPVIPVHIRARNSALFYLFDRIHPTLRDITLFHETLNKAAQPFAVTVGAPIAAASLPQGPDAAIAMLRRAVLDLAEDPTGTVRLIPAARRPQLA
ncbi:MAG: glycerol acyltransferase [Limimaricola sp.]|uniref:1-acyl-sn-glycerol-3-phosphate acyltransferase n=1 Tax=Limimaricola sp. TaxID=2211665 RepID=UPI001D7D101F|nr:1-acyl-sn-glycerol-3-phosphate acyltransferase [Limimaricola sp.]MBI1418546.1 glycerol acyltransferase [Limimaricola sp.]